MTKSFNFVVPFLLTVSALVFVAVITPTDIYFGRLLHSSILCRCNQSIFLSMNT